MSSGSKDHASRVHFSRQIIRHVESAQPHKMTDGGAGRQTNRKRGGRKGGARNPHRQRYPTSTFDIASTLRRRSPSPSLLSTYRYKQKHAAANIMGNRSSKGSSGGQDEDAGSGLFLSPELQGERENGYEIFVPSAGRRCCRRRSSSCHLPSLCFGVRSLFSTPSL
jgi:hypothetical protein